MVEPIRALPLPSTLTDDERVYFEPPKVGDRFKNPWGVNPNPGPRGIVKWKLQGNAFAEEKRSAPPVPVAPRAKEGFASLPREARVQWLGHASFFIELDGVRIVIDPIFGRVAGVLPRLVEAPIGPEDLPPVDAVLLTHGHRDHYDAPSVVALLERSGGRAVCLVPQGLTMPRSCSNVVELSWWQAVRVGAVDCSFVPAQHWHARGPLDRNRALWGGWVVRGSRSIYHAGDTGFFDGFGAIGKVVGPVDLAILPLGAFEPRWFMGEQHMSPEGSVRAWELLGARHFLGMHWGTFDLTDEPAAHGPGLLRHIVSERSLPGDRFHVVAHGGGLGFDAQGGVEPFAAI